MNDKNSVVVVGAGIVGVCTALALVRKGLKVTLINDHEPGTGASFGNAGLVSVDSCVPIALPGMLRQVPAWLRDPLGPLSVRPAYLPMASKWLWQWLRAGASEARVIEQSRALRALHQSALSIYRDLLGEKFNSLVKVTGQLHVWEQAGPATGVSLPERLRAENGVFPRLLNAAQLRELAPGLSPAIKHGEFYENNGFVLSPLGLVKTLFGLFLEQGGQFLQDKVTGLSKENAGRGYRIVTATRNLTTPQLVMCTGAWSKPLLQGLGVSISLETERGYHLSFARDALDLPLPVVHREKAFAVTPMADSVRVAGFVEIAGLNAPPHMLREAVMRRHAKHLFPDLNLDRQERFWLGFRPSTPDSLPYLGPVNGHRGLYFALGHGHTGLTGAPMSAKALAHLIVGEDSPIDLQSYQPQRY